MHFDETSFRLNFAQNAQIRTKRLVAQVREPSKKHREGANGSLGVTINLILWADYTAHLRLRKSKEYGFLVLKPLHFASVN